MDVSTYIDENLAPARSVFAPGSISDQGALIAALIAAGEHCHPGLSAANPFAYVTGVAVYGPAMAREALAPICPDLTLTDDFLYGFFEGWNGEQPFRLTPEKIVGFDAGRAARAQWGQAMQVRRTPVHAVATVAAVALDLETSVWPTIDFPVTVDGNRIFLGPAEFQRFLTFEMFYEWLDSVGVETLVAHLRQMCEGILAEGTLEESVARQVQANG